MATTLPTQFDKCAYSNDAGGDKCIRRRSLPNGDTYCTFHSKLTKDSVFINEFKDLIATKDGTWCGFIFPIFPKEFKFPSEINFEINARNSTFTKLIIVDVTFDESCDFSGSTFNDATEFRRCTFTKMVLFYECKFLKEADFRCVTFKGDTAFSYTEFSGTAFLQVLFECPATFDRVVFGGRVLFSRWGNAVVLISGVSVTASASSVVALGDAEDQPIPNRTTPVGGSSTSQPIACFKKILSRITNLRKKPDEPHWTYHPISNTRLSLTNITFAKPEYVRFDNIDMSHVELANTNFRGVNFFGVNWYQPDLKRGGLYDEVLTLNHSNKLTDQQIGYSACETSYRNIRVTLEENRDFSAAADFYVGEMESHQKQLGFFKKYFSVVFLYWLVSGYGTKVFRAITVLSCLLLIHTALSFIIDNYQDHWNGNSNWMFRESFLTDTGLTGFSVSHENSHAIPLKQWLDIIFRLAVISQIAMLIFAFRARIKRY